MKVLQFLGNGFRLVAFFRAKGPGIHLDQSEDIRIQGFDEIHYFFEITVGVLEIAAVWYWKVKLPSNPCGVTYIVQKKSHTFLIR
jgi:hypothetical protein